MFFKADDFLSLHLFLQNLLAVGINVESMGVLESCQRKAISPHLLKKKAACQEFLETTPLRPGRTLYWQKRMYCTRESLEIRQALRNAREWTITALLNSWESKNVPPKKLCYSNKKKKKKSNKHLLCSHPALMSFRFTLDALSVHLQCMHNIPGVDIYNKTFFFQYTSRLEYKCMQCWMLLENIISLRWTVVL